MALVGSETDLALGRGGIPLPDLIAQSAPPSQEDPAAGLGPDMGVPRLMRDDTAGGGVPTESALRQEDVNMNPVDPAADLGNPTNPMDSDGGRGGRGYRRPLQRAPWNQNYRYTQEDFYGSGNPNITFTDPRGVQLYVPQAGKLPMSIWASQMQSAQGQLAQTRKALADLLESSKTPQTAPPYQRDFSRLVTGAQNNFIRGLAAQYGGNEDLAWEEVAKEGTQANRDWRAMNADAEGVGQFVKYGWDDASAWAKDVMSGKMRVTPEMRQHVEELMYGVGSLKGSDATTGDFAKAAKAIRPLQRDMSLVKFGTEYVLQHAPEIYSKLESEPIYEVKNGQRIVRTRTREEATDAFYDAMVQEAKMLIPDVPEDEARKYVEAIIPRVKSDLVDVKAANIPQSSGGSGAGAGEASLARTSVITGPSGEVKKTVIFPIQSTGGKPHKVAKGNFNTVSSGGVDLYAPGLTWNDQGHFFIEGTKLGSDDVTRIKKNVEGFEGGDEGVTEQVVEYITANKLGKTDRVAATNNGGEMQTLWGTRDPFEVVAMQLRERGEQVTAAEVKAAWSDPEVRRGITQTLK